MKPIVVVVGSLNMDFVVRVARPPSPGETVFGQTFQMVPGGKGANQACAAGKLGGSSVTVRMIGRVGYDVFADHLKASLSAAAVDVSAVHAAKSQPTGIAFIWVDASGQNSIVVAPGANMELAAADVEAMRKVFRGGRIALFQLETPIATVAAALELAKAEGLQTILDPSPAQVLPRGLLEHVDILTPNETEGLGLLGRTAARIGAEEALPIAAGLQRLGPQTVVLKLGDQGCFWLSAAGYGHLPCFPVEPRDTTAAGDVFNAALAIALAEERDLNGALRFANAAAAISVTRQGAQTSVPSRREVDGLLTSTPHIL